ncbi:MAG: 3',5'-cyclic-AMP phosphodiesterase [Gammaproteobacteria bacterium]
MTKAHDGIDTLRLVQFTDMHLYADAQRDLLGVTTEQSFLDTLQLARAEQWPVTAVLATGDLVHDCSAAGYQRLRAHFATLDVPVHCLPGNHDDPDLMAQHLAGGSVQISTCVDYDTWRIVMLDSTIRGSDAGHLAPAQLALLESQLANAGARHVLICLHHNPIAVGSPWLDTMMVDNAAEFFAIVDRHPAVRAILWGHVHQNVDTQRRGVRLLASPSTCIQFQPQSSAFALDEAAPGYRWLVLHGDGGIATDIARLANFTAPLDRQSAGY